MTTHSSILASEIPWTEEPGGPWSTGLQRLGQKLIDLAHKHSPKLHICSAGEYKHSFLCETFHHLPEGMNHLFCFSVTAYCPTKPHICRHKCTHMLTCIYQYINTARNRIGLITLRFWNDETSLSNRCIEIHTLFKIKISFVVIVDSHTAVRNIQRDFLLPGFFQWLLLFSHFSCVQLFGTPWTVAHQAPLSPGIL